MSSVLRVPLLDLPAQHARLAGELRGALDRVFAAGAFVLGPEVEALERELAAFCDADRAVGCGSGSDALLLALQALDVGPGDEVICPSFTFFATAGSIARLGAEPVFADIEPAGYGLDAASVRAAAARCTRLRAIVAVHLYGRCADLARLEEVARTLGVPIVEDAAQAIGARDERGRRVGARSRAACFSFYPTKNLGGAGDGGLVTTADAELAARIARLRVHGASRRYQHDEIGMNSRLDALQAAVLRVKLRHLAAWTAARRATAARYDAAFRAAGALPSDVPLEAGGLPLRLPAAPAPPAEHVYHQYVVRVPADRRDAFRQRLAACGVETDVYYPLGLHQQPCFAKRGAPASALPETERAAREVVALPVHAELDDAKREHVIASVLEAVTRG